LVKHSPFDLICANQKLTPAYRVFTQLPGHSPKTATSLLAFRPPLEFGHSSPAGNVKLPAALMRFISLQRINDRSPLTRVCLSRYVPLSGFLNLPAGYSSNRLEVLFHTSNAHGISPSRAFPSQTAHCLVDNDYPLSITTTQLPASCQKSLLSAFNPKTDYRQPEDCFQGFVPSESPFTFTPGVTQT
jgi:hypothetical protein